MMKTRLKQTYQHTVLTIYMTHKYNTTEAYEKRIYIYIFYLVNQKSLSHIIITLKNLLQLVLLLIPNEATPYNQKIAAYQFLLCLVHSLPSR